MSVKAAQEVSSPDAQSTRLAPEQLRWRCDPSILGFDSTTQVAPLAETFGQDRALAAIEFGLNREVHGYNIFVVGPSGSGRRSTVRTKVEEAARTRQAPGDCCYVHNFSDPYRPRALQLAAGQGPQLRADMENLIEACWREIRRAFESDTYGQRRTSLARTFDHQRHELLEEVRAHAEERGFIVELTPMIAVVPTAEPGVPLTTEAYEQLSPEKKAEIEEKSRDIQERMTEASAALRRLDREGHEALQALDREIGLAAVSHVFEAVRSSWASQTDVQAYLNEIEADVVAHLNEFRAVEHWEKPDHGAHSAYGRYGVNVLETHEATSGAPIVFEPNPTYYNLLGRIDYEVGGGGFQTDFNRIKPGALHRANGGFLILQARDLLLNPFAWDALKRSLRDQQIRVENLSEQLSIFPTASLKPEPVPLQVKVVLIGDPLTHSLLYRLDEDFRKLFRVKAEFGMAMDRCPTSIRAYAAFVSAQIQEHGLLAFRSDAVARVIEHGARLVGHQERLTTVFDVIGELVVEADSCARKAAASEVEATHVDEAIAEHDHRLDLVEEEIQRLIDEDTIAIETSSPSMGQVNGLSILLLDGYAFARPSRISARTAMGTDGVVNIEREVELSGPTHSKGVLILASYLAGKYAQDHPLAVSARITFEQLYDEVEGDSASSAELYALLSVLADLPLRQDIAVTGSVNQNGEIQAVGGVTTKIEGFYAVCKARGLSGTQGVIIPRANVRHLMLKPEVVAAVAAGQFHVWAISNVDEGMELLTGMPAGTQQPDGSYSRETVHGRVDRRLARLAQRLAGFGRAPQVLPARRTASLSRMADLGQRLKPAREQRT